MWIAPDGQEFITTPGSRLLFPELSRPTASVTVIDRPASQTLGLTMPRRSTTRAQDRTARIHRERRLNEEFDVAEAEAEIVAWSVDSAEVSFEGSSLEPPPF